MTNKIYSAGTPASRRSRRAPALTLRPGAIVFLLLFIFALLFTQILRNTASSVFFWFIVLIPLLSFLVLLIGRASVQVYVASDMNRCEKMTSVGYEIRVINGSPFPLPFVEAMVNTPRPDGVRSLSQKLVLSLIPLGMHVIKNTVRFRYRGLYEIGISKIYLYDYLRIFRIRIDVDNYSNVTVLPRKLLTDGGAQTANSDIPSPVSAIQTTAEQSEQANIRDYRNGDPMKSIHWKMSSKAQDLQVRDFNTSDDNSVYIFVDFAAPTPPPEAKKAQKQKQIRQLLKKRERTPLLPALRLQKLAEKKEELDAAVGAGIRGVKERLAKRRQASKRRRRLAAGNSASSIASMDEIDALIRATARKRAHIKTIDPDKQRKKEEAAEKKAEEAALLEAQIAAEDAVVEKLLEEIDGDMSEISEREMDAAVQSWGGMPRDDIADEMPELCADGVAEIAISSVMNELRHGHSCTVAWFDPRSESGVAIHKVTDQNSFAAVYDRFAGAPVVPETQRVFDLTRVVSEAANVTIRVITANMDPSALAEYSRIPALFGGAGSGCVAEVLFLNPKENYPSPTERGKYVANAAARLRQQGVLPTEMRIVKGRQAPLLCATPY